MGLRLRHTSLFLTYVLAPLCAISNFNYEQVNPRNFPAAMLLHRPLSRRLDRCDRMIQNEGHDSRKLFTLKKALCR